MKKFEKAVSLFIMTMIASISLAAVTTPSRIVAHAKMSREPAVVKGVSYVKGSF